MGWAQRNNKSFKNTTIVKMNGIGDLDDGSKESKSILSLNPKQTVILLSVTRPDWSNQTIHPLLAGEMYAIQIEKHLLSFDVILSFEVSKDEPELIEIPECRKFMYGFIARFGMQKMKDMFLPKEQSLYATFCSMALIAEQIDIPHISPSPKLPQDFPRMTHFAPDGNIYTNDDKKKVGILGPVGYGKTVFFSGF